VWLVRQGVHQPSEDKPGSLVLWEYLALVSALVWSESPSEPWSEMLSESLSGRMTVGLVGLPLGAESAALLARVVRSELRSSSVALSWSMLLLHLLLLPGRPLCWDHCWQR